MRKRSIVLAGLLLCAWAPCLAFAKVTVEDPGTFVVDRADILDRGAEQQIGGVLRELEQKTGAQVKVLTVSTTEGEAIFDFAFRHAEAWKLGQQGKDNGVLIAVAVRDRQASIMVGYGLEGLLPDSWCGTLRRSKMNPNFRRGDYGQGLYAATSAIANRIADAQNVTLSGVPAIRHEVRGRRKTGGFACAGIMPLLILIIVISSIGRRRRHHGRWGGGLLPAILLGSMMGSGGRSWGGGGGFSGGGFGGSFGGGGGFGGGGSSGGW